MKNNKKEEIGLDVRFSIPNDSIHNFLEDLKPYITNYKQINIKSGNKIITNINRAKRVEVVLSTIKYKEKIRSGTLYHKLRRAGSYLKCNYKTFQRDIIYMALEKMIKTKKIIGGKYGTTTLISKPF